MLNDLQTKVTHLLTTKEELGNKASFKIKQVLFPLRSHNQYIYLIFYLNKKTNNFKHISNIYSFSSNFNDLGVGH